MADEIPVIPKAGSLFINSGNIVNWNRLKRKPTQNPTEEISECISTTLQSFLNDSDKNELQYMTELNCVHQKYKETVPRTDRGDYKLTVKIFLSSHISTDAIKEACEKALSELDVSFIETVLLAFPEVENEELTLEVIKPYWKALETLVYREMVLHAGLADLDKHLLEQLYEDAEIKPVINQVNLDSCCVMPKDLVEYAKLNDIQLLTHNDPRTSTFNQELCSTVPTELNEYAKLKDIQLLAHNDPKNVLPAETLQEVLRETSTEKDSEGWEPLWVMRYSVLVKCRGIVKSKGYLLKAERDIKKRK